MTERAASPALSYESEPSLAPDGGVGCRCRCWYREESGVPSKLFARLRRIFPSPFYGIYVDVHVCEKPKRAFHSTGFFAQHHFVSAAKDFHLLAAKLKLLWQPDSLAIAGFENPRGGHSRLPCIYSSVYTNRTTFRKTDQRIHAFTRSAAATTSFARNCAMIELRCLMSKTSRSMVTAVKSGAERSMLMLSMLPSCSAMTCATCA